MFKLLTKKTFIIYTICIALVIVSLCASFINTGIWKTKGSGNDTSQEGAAPDTGITISLCHWDNGGSTETDLVKDVCKAFTYKTGINVDVQIISSYETQFPNIMAAQNVPDVFCVPDGNFGTWVATGVMEPLDDYVASSTNIDLSNIWSSALSRYQYNGKTMGSGTLYCMPKDITPYVMYYNKDLFDKYGVPYPDDKVPWDPYTATYYWRMFGIDRNNALGGPTVTSKGKIKDDHIYGVAKLYPESLIWSNGADYLSADRTEVLIDTPEFIEAFDYIQAAICNDYVAPAYSLLASTSEKTLFLNGKAACYIEGRSVTADLRKQATFDWDIAPIPAFDTEFQNINGWSGSIGYAVYTNSEHKDEAYRLAEFFTSAEGQRIMTEAGFSIPLYNDPSTIEALYKIEEGQKPANTGEWLRAAQYQKAGLWQYLPSTRWKTQFDKDTGALYLEDESMRLTAEQFVTDEKEIILNIIKTDFPELFK